MPEARIQPLPSEQWSDEMWDAIAIIGAKRPEPGAPPGPSSNILGIYANNPPLVKGWMPFSNHLKHPSISDRLREIAIIRTTWLGGGEYEWAQHRRIGRVAGLTEAEIDALSDGPGIEWAEAEGIAIRAIDEMIGDRQVSDATWNALAAHYSVPQLIDFVFLVGTYEMHCLAFNTLGLQLDPGLKGFPADRPRGGAR
ncbi:carboxymuconolactone decarboxylase family protein [Microbacterium sp. No. 7]|uniref:carboxymuconolactone decarboxylase family protein n=1 Tax=Microbacterium sp. No. 7 TaxID=1714373 RepID=UPI0006CF3737|nr:carboxymuconolactone decarboxylase family protein [Microbacterium sp. No. 7]